MKLERYKKIPASLKLMDQWVCFSLEYGEKGEKNKIPKDPKTGQIAKVNEPTTWSDYKTAVNGVKKHGFDGISFALTNGIFGVDVDHAIIDGKLTQEIRDIITTLDSYSEINSSMTGEHILCKGEIPDGARRKGNIEIYNAGRFFTVTGDSFSNQEVEERTAQAKIIHAKYLAKEESTGSTTCQPQELTLTDSELINKACSAKNGPLFKILWNGDITEHGGDHSAADQTLWNLADQALCNLLAYWTNGNGYRMDTLFKQSGLMRDKWNEKHGADTYGNMTIKKALDDFTSYQAPDYSIQQK